MSHWCILWDVVCPLRMCFQVFESSPSMYYCLFQIWSYIFHILHPYFGDHICPNLLFHFLTEACDLNCAAQPLLKKWTVLNYLLTNSWAFLIEIWLQWLFYKYFLNLQRSNQKDVFPVGNSPHSLHFRQPALKRFLTSFTFSALEL